MQRAVAIVDDDAGVGNSLGAMLRVVGLKTHVFLCVEDILENLADLSLDLVLTDVTLPGMSGFDLISEFQRRGCLLPVIVMTGGVGVMTREEVLSQGAVEFIEKPCRAEVLLGAVEKALSQ